MIAKIDSFAIIQQLKRGDVVIKNGDEYMITQISENHITLILTGTRTNLKMFTLDDLLQGNWYLKNTGNSVTT
jgi:hypothetical protein